jgi:hypothetical protein
LREEMPMPVDALSRLARERPAWLLAALALVSGALSAQWGQAFSLSALKPLSTLFLMDPEVMPNGFFYGMALGIGLALWSRKPWALPVVLVTTMYAWSLAIHTAVRLQRNEGDDVHLIAGSLCAGAVGAGITHLGCSLIAADLRRPWWRVALTCGVGAALGMLFYLGERRYLDERLLYLVWQPAVAFCIGLGFPRTSPQVRDVAG